MGPTLVFSQLQVLLSHLWGLKKKKKSEGRRHIKGEKEGVEQERRKERKKVLKERKSNKKVIIKNYLKKPQKTKTKPSLLAKPVLLVFFGCSQLRQPSPALLCPNQHSGSLRPSSPAVPRLTGSGTHPPPGYGCEHPGPSLIRTLPGAFGLTSL